MLPAQLSVQTEYQIWPSCARLTSQEVCALQPTLAQGRCFASSLHPHSRRQFVRCGNIRDHQRGLQNKLCICSSSFVLQVATELILGFPKNFINKEILSRQQHLWTECLDGFICVPINLPGFGKLRLPCPSACSYCPDALKHLHNVETRFYCPQTFHT